MKPATRCGCDTQTANYKIVGVEMHGDTDTVTVTTRALCCGRTYMDELTRAQFEAGLPQEREG